ncbi:RNA polymerase factor sigma-70 [Paludibacterium purpuratum]|uniref:RNA polymerase sigma-70 factor (ECF subfamily) n=1 Tax=Paludibacterium purpuratum TaxID=1144873 RepID=A0A4R7B349_9NEIS|nr:RNA polymerase factor sigma-70 [Paludibacterium purpuratum]TDR76450.1 RNA polymerase sigma-70 factor (ECF subfamily) [Paludibacterium purpuratum]
MNDDSLQPFPHGWDALQDHAFLVALRRQMLKFATLQLGDRHQAEDAVQEALAGALKNAASFGGQAALKTWVLAILKNKIADILRHNRRMVDASQLLNEAEEEEDFRDLFDRKGFWEADEHPKRWGDPVESFRQQQFWAVFEACLERLPAQQGRVFMMREVIELDTDEICDAVGIRASNLFVMLHRARLRLRECLEDRWFAKEAS